MTDIPSNIRLLRQQIPENVKIVAVSKTMPVNDILIAYRAGHRIFGENRVSELVSKKPALPPDIEWHFIGHLQTNKVKLLVPHVAMIQSIDSFRLLEAVNRESEKAGRKTDCLLQFHIAREETKYGFDLQEASDALGSDEFGKLNNIRIRGVMGMATFTGNMDMVGEEFRQLKNYFKVIKSKYFPEDPLFNEVSMGMSGDYLTAIKEGATIVRIGTIIFGDRKMK